MLTYLSAMNGLIVGLLRWCAYLPSVWVTHVVASQLKGEEHATLHKPPNHKLFDTTNQNISPILQKHIAAQNAKANPTNLAPVFNISVGNEVLDILRPPPPPVPAPVPIPVPPHAPQVYDAPCPLLLHPSRMPGLDISISEFCQQYDLGPNVLKKFQDNFYNDARVLRFVTIDELKEMGFRLGEVAGLRDAVERWSIPKFA
jgi:hypothetical protein